MLRKQPFSANRSFQIPARTEAIITLHLTPGLDIGQHVIHHPIRVDPDSKLPETVTAMSQFTTQHQDYMPSTQADTSATLMTAWDTSGHEIAADAPSSKRMKL